VPVIGAALLMLHQPTPGEILVPHFRIASIDKRESLVAEPLSRWHRKTLLRTVENL
jgi:hypothetical protein